MVFNSCKTVSIGRILTTDAILLLFVCMIPVLSHVVAYPLYKLNPMLFCLLTGISLVRNRWNAYLLAILMPLLSFVFSGFPTAPNMVCMVPELLVMVAVLDLLANRISLFPATLIAILVGKMVFYLLRTILFSPVVLFGTPIWIQLLTSLLFAVLFSLWNKKTNVL